jgi:hypothetical protein
VDASAQVLINLMHHKQEQQGLLLEEGHVPPQKRHPEAVMVKVTQTPAVMTEQPVACKAARLLGMRALCASQSFCTTDLMACSIQSLECSSIEQSAECFM